MPLGGHSEEEILAGEWAIWVIFWAPQPWGLTLGSWFPLVGGTVRLTGELSEASTLVWGVRICSLPPEAGRTAAASVTRWSPPAVWARAPAQLAPQCGPTPRWGLSWLRGELGCEAQRWLRPAVAAAAAVDACTGRASVAVWGPDFGQLTQPMPRPARGWPLPRPFSDRAPCYREDCSSWGGVRLWGTKAAHTPSGIWAGRGAAITGFTKWARQKLSGCGL